MNLSPSAINTFTGCGLRFQYQYVERLPQGPDSEASALGLAVHACLFDLWYEYGGAGYQFDFGPHAEAGEALVSNAMQLDVGHPIVAGCELRLEMDLPNERRLVGIIDRLDIEDGEFVVIDYKTGKTPDSDWSEQGKLIQGLYYALLVEATFGKLPKAVRFYYLQDPCIIEMIPQPFQMKGLRQRLEAMGKVIDVGVFRPRKSPLCSVCPYMALCPLWSE